MKGTWLGVIFVLTISQRSGKAEFLADFKEELWTWGQGVATLAKTVVDVGAIINDAVEEDCEYTCPKGSGPVPKDTHLPSSNGCGSYGLQLKDVGIVGVEFDSCCHSHDVCYDTCGSDKDICDLEFKKCLYKQCKAPGVRYSLLEVKKCKAAAKVMHTSIVAVGCRAFLDSQRMACRCVKLPKKDEL